MLRPSMKRSRSKRKNKQNSKQSNDNAKQECSKPKHPSPRTPPHNSKPKSSNPQPKTTTSQTSWPAAAAHSTTSKQSTNHKASTSSTATTTTSSAGSTITIFWSQFVGCWTRRAGTCLLGSGRIGIRIRSRRRGIRLLNGIRLSLRRWSRSWWITVYCRMCRMTFSKCSLCRWKAKTINLFLESSWSRSRYGSGIARSFTLSRKIPTPRKNTSQ